MRQTPGKWYVVRFFVRHGNDDEKSQNKKKLSQHGDISSEQ